MSTVQRGDQVQHYPALLTATREGTATERSSVLAGCDPRAPGDLVFQLATIWSTTTLSLPEFARLVAAGGDRVALPGDPGKPSLLLDPNEAGRLLAWLHQLDGDRTHPPGNRGA